MPFDVSTVPADQIAWVNGRSTLVLQHNYYNKISFKDIVAADDPASNKVRYTCRARQLRPRLKLVKSGSPVAINCESVQIVNNVGWRENGLGRVSIINTDGQIIYDAFVYYPREIEQCPSPRCLGRGVSCQDMRPENGAQPHARVLAAIRKILDKSGLVVAHDVLKHEELLEGLDLSNYDVCDTQRLSGFPSKSPKLDTLAAGMLSRNMQAAEHSSIEDAQATMDLFQWHEKYGVEESDYASEVRDSESPVGQAAGDNAGELFGSDSPQSQTDGTSDGAHMPASESLKEQTMVAQSSFLLQPPFLPTEESMRKITSWVSRML